MNPINWSHTIGNVCYILILQTEIILFSPHFPLIFIKMLNKLSFLNINTHIENNQQKSAIIEMK